MATLQKELHDLWVLHREGQEVTQANRASILDLMATQLTSLGYSTLQACDLDSTHVTALLRLWRTQQRAPGTVKNRLTVLRWWAAKVGRPQVLKTTNRPYRVPARPTVATLSKAQELAPEKLAAIGDPYVRLSVELQRAFGLRRDEAITMFPSQAHQGKRLVVFKAWGSGARPRVVPVRTAAQRAVLQRAKRLAGTGALIPEGRSYAQQVGRYEYWTAAVGLRQMHGLRYAYAQERYEELTGFAAPAAGGPPSATWTPAQRLRDQEARRVLSAELGHGRNERTLAYLGR